MNHNNAREQLMEDIDGIIESHFSAVFPHAEDYEDLRDALTDALCDAVCAHFPNPSHTIEQITPVF